MRTKALNPDDPNPGSANIVDGDAGYNNASTAEADAACTRWLRARGLMAAQLDPHLGAYQHRGMAAARERSRRVF